MPIGSYIQRVFDVYRQKKVRRFVKVTVVTLVIGALVLLEVVSALLPVEATTLVLVVIGVVSLELVESKVYAIEEQLESGREYQLHETPRQAYDELTGCLEPSTEGHKRVYMINYIGRGDITRNLITTAVDNDYDIYLLVKYPSTLDDSTAVDDGEINEQVFRFVVQMLPPAFFNEYENLTIRFYRYPASVNAIKIADEGIGTGWYTVTSEDGQPRAQGRGRVSPMLVSTQQSREHEVLDRWFRGVFSDLWADAATLEDLYEAGDEAGLVDWVENHAERRRSLVTELSEDHPETMEELFDG